MSIKVMSWVWENSPTSGSERLVLLALADSANDDGICWPSLETIARKANISKRYVIDILKKLEANAAILVERRRITSHKNQSNVYTVVRNSSLRCSEEGITTLQTGSEEGITTSSEEGITSVVSPASPEPSLTVIKPSIEQTDFQKLFLETFGAKRFKNKIQMQTVADMEEKHDSQRIKALIIWAANKGMGLGDAIASINSALNKPIKTNAATQGRGQITENEDGSLYV